MYEMIGIASAIVLAFACYHYGKAQGIRDARTLIEALEREVRQSRGVAVVNEMRCRTNPAARRIYPPRARA